MGIDAEMMIRVRGQKPSDEQLARWSWELCRSVGAKNFFIQDGLPKAEYDVAIQNWRNEFDKLTATPEFSGWRDKRDVHKALLDRLGEHPKEMRRAIALSEAYEWDDEKEDRYESGKAWNQDGDTIIAGDDEWLLEVRLWTRYYGVGYERGDLQLICSVAEWCEVNIPNCEVWYGGDSSGVLMEPFGPGARWDLKRHLYSQSGRDYFSSFGRLSPADHPIRPAPCSLCIPGEPRFNQHGFGGNYIAVNCRGCGKSWSTRDDGATWTEEGKE